MNYFRLIWKNAWRKKIRTSLTILSVLVAFLLFALLSSIGYAFRGGVDVADAERLIVINKVSLINPLPMSYLNQIASTDGVQSVTHASWFGGYYQEPREQFGQFPVDPQAYFDMFPEYKIPAEQLEAFERNRTGAVVGEELATKYGWTIGDRIPIQATIWTRADGGRSWEFDLEGIFSTDDPRGSTALMLFQYDYFEEARAFGKGTVGWYVLRVAKGADPVQVARRIDLMFANSQNETWEIKKKTSDKIFTSNIKRIDDELYDFIHITGHKLLGAGGGGYYLAISDINTKLNGLFSKHVKKIKIKINNTGVIGWKL